MRRPHSGHNDADRIIDQVLKSDRADLATGHDRSRTRRKAMAFLAAGAGTTTESSAATLGWVAKLLSMKGVVGTLGTLAVAGGIGYGVAATQLSDGPGGSSQESTASPAAQRTPALNSEMPHPDVVVLAPKENETPPAPEPVNVRPEGGGPAIVSERRQTMVVPSEEPDKSSERTELQTDPEVRVIDSSRARLTIEGMKVNTKRSVKSAEQ